MPSIAQLEAELDGLRAVLAEKDKQAATDKAAAIAAAEATDAAKSAAERAEAAKAERETIRRGSWVNHLLSQADPNAPVDFAAIDAGVPKDEGQWPPGVNPADFVMTGGARIRSENKVEVADTTLGRMLAMTPKLN